MKLYIHVGAVIGNGQVPFDMLRYDRAFPYREVDSAEIERRVHREGTDHEVLIATVRTTKARPWSDGRWKSFNREVRHMVTEEVR